MCVVEGSKWPDHEDELAIDTLKMLMLLKMNESLNTLDSVISFIRQGGITVFQVCLFGVVVTMRTQLFILAC